MDKLKVLLVAYNNLGKGGIQSQMMGIIRSLKDKVDFDVVVWDNVKDYYTPELEQYGVKIIRCFRNPGRTLLRRKADAFVRYGELRKILQKVIRENGPYDVIHCNNAFDAAPCLEAAYKAGIPVRISHAHSMESPDFRKKLTYPAYRMLYAHHRRKITRYANYMVGCSKQVTDYFFGKENGLVVHIGIDLSKFQNVSLSEKVCNTIQLLHVGGMNEKKNQLFLLDIMEVLIKRNPNVRMILIGDGDTYLARIKAGIQTKNLESYVTVMPGKTNVPKAMAAADLLLLPSASEGFGIVLIEAQTLGLRCLASDAVSEEANCGGVRYLPLEKGAEYWAEKILEEIENSCKHSEKYDVSEFALENMSRTIYDIYRNAE